MSLYPILRLILPHLERQRGPHNLKQASLAKLYADVYGFAKNSNSYKKLANYRLVSCNCNYWIIDIRLTARLLNISYLRLVRRVWSEIFYVKKYKSNSNAYISLEETFSKMRPLYFREPMSSEFLSMGNDFADRAYCVLEKKLLRIGTGFTIARINTFLDGISERNVTKQQKVETFRILFRQITGFEMKWVTRIILKDLRLGIGIQRILHSAYI